MNSDLLLHCFLRWGHILSAIVWVGTLFSFALVVGPMIKSFDAELRPKLTLRFVPRGFYLMRVTSLLTVILGLAIFWWNYLHHSNMMVEIDGHKALSDRARFIMYGMTLGLIMAANVWLVVWPAQRKLFAAMRSGSPQDPKLSKRTSLACALNLYLSGPMLMLMIMPTEYSSFDKKAALIACLGSVVLVHLLRKFISKTAP